MRVITEKSKDVRVNRMDKMTLTLNSPITEEQWDAITDVDFEHTNEITFHTKHGKEVKFVKASAEPKKGKWIPIQRGFFNKEVTQVKCDQCGNLLDLIGVNCGRGDANYCPNCGADMRGE